MARNLGKSNNLPNTILVDRPRITAQLQWSDKNGNAMESNLNQSFKSQFTISKDTDHVNQLTRDPTEPSRIVTGKQIGRAHV